ncbi:MAG TPA: TIGR00341 family protein, partial [Bacteroidales bacterium]|nr:TIGR00341 family protein [Bacteroidales bacterium]
MDPSSTENKNTKSTHSIIRFFKYYFYLRKDKENELETIANIRAGVEFKGASLWILIFAILIASLGLNVNSTAVIIGAMLISPLMGPIIGMGLALG